MNQLLSQRDLHAFLESKRQFSDWIQDRIEKYGLIENEDYVTIHEIVKRENAKRQGASKRIEYVLTLDTAKELAMVEGNGKGKQARRYFIACEKSYKDLYWNKLSCIKICDGEFLTGKVNIKFIARFML